jgi:hypothetical protein
MVSREIVILCARHARHVVGKVRQNEGDFLAVGDIPWNAIRVRRIRFADIDISPCKNSAWGSFTGRQPNPQEYLPHGFDQLDLKWGECGRFNLRTPSPDGS